MPGVFNTTGHETEGETRGAAHDLLNGLASVYQALALVEAGDGEAARSMAANAGDYLRTVASPYDELFARGNDSPVLATMPPQADREWPGLQEQLQRYGYSTSIRNRDLFGIAAREIRQLADLLDHVNFEGRPSDWYGVRDVIRQVTRLTEVGVTVSRLASLTGSDPDLTGGVPGLPYGDPGMPY